MAEELLINVNVQGDEQIPGLDKKLDNVNKTAGKTKDAFSQMRTEMRNAKADMLTAAEGTDKYNDAMKRAALAADKMRDMNDKIKASQRDVGVVAKNVTGMVSGLAGAFSTAQGIIGLFGVESDNVTKAILKVTQVMQVTSGIAQFADSFDNMKDIFLAVKLRIAEMVAVKTTDTAITDVNTGAQVANATAIKGVGVAATTSAKAVMKALGPYALIAAAIGALVYGVSKLIDKINEVPEDIKLNIEIDKSIQSKLNDTYNKSMQFAYDYNQAIKSGNKERIDGLSKTGKEEFGLHQIQLDMIADNVDNWIKAFDTYLKYAEQTYKMEALFKIKSENEVADILSKGRIAKATTERNDLIKELKAKGVNEETISKYGTGTFIGANLPGGNKSMKDIFTTVPGTSLMNDFKRLDQDISLLFSKDGKDIFGKLDRLYKVSSELTKANQAGEIVKESLSNNDIINKEILNLKNETEKTLGEMNKVFGTKGKDKGKTTPEKSTVEVYKAPVRADITEASPEVERALIDQTMLAKIDGEIEDGKNTHNNKMELINDRAKMGNVAYIKSLIQEEQKIKDFNTNKVKNQELTSKGLKTAYEAQINLHNKNVDEVNNLYDEELNKLNGFNSNKADIQNRLNAANEAFGKATNDKERQRISNTIKNLEDEKLANEGNIKGSNKKLGELDEKKKGLTTKGGDITSEYEAKLQTSKDAIIDANNQIADSTDQLARLNREKWRGMGEDAIQYLGILGGLTNTLGQYFEVQQKQIDSQTEGFKDIANGSKITKKEEEKLRKTDLKTYNAAQKAKNGTDKDRAEFTEQLELAAWEVKAKLFEKQKMAEKASAWINFASGVIGIWSHSPDLGLIAGPIVAAVQSAALLATTLTQIKSINAQRLDSPSDGSSSSSAPSGASFAALTPSQTTMTTSQENLNMMNASNKVQTVVKVSEINEVQNTVRVRENNSSY